MRFFVHYNYVLIVKYGYAAVVTECADREEIFLEMGKYVIFLSFQWKGIFWE